MLPRLYHAHHSRHLEDLPFWLELARRQGSPILELGCGSGRVLLHLARAGYHTTGLERDADMLYVLRENMEPDLGGQVELVQGDMAAFELGRRFRLVIMPCNTFTTLSTAQRRATLECVRQHLEPRGLFAASLPNPALLRRLPLRSEAEVEESFPHPLDGEPVQVSSGWERSKQSLTIYWHYDHLLPDGRVERVSMQASHALIPLEVCQAELEVAGLDLVECYGDFDRSPYSPDAPSLVLLASPRF
jgi:SAM-dependent methyltransferase